VDIFAFKLGVSFPTFNPVLLAIDSLQPIESAA
jgi:hypothetical protein